jgi:hypothetical protein
VDAIVTCEVHSLDLCAVHMRKHFDRVACRLVPADSQPTPMENIGERLSASDHVSGASRTCGA